MFGIGFVCLFFCGNYVGHLVCLLFLEIMLAIGFVCCLNDLCLALRLYVIFGNYVLHWVCLFVGWVTYVWNWVCLYVGWVTYVW